MKKTTYTLGALLVLCLVGLGLLLAGRLADQRELKTLNQRVEEVTAEVVLLRQEKVAWEEEKTRVAQSLGSVRGVLVKTLVDLEEVSAQIGLPLSTPVPAAQSPKPTQEATATPAPKATATPKATAAPSPTPAATKAPETDAPTTATSPTPVVSATPAAATAAPK